MSTREELSCSLIRAQGVSKFKTTHSITVFMENSLGQIIMCAGPDVPHDNDIGFSPGCLFMSTTTGIAYSNVGSATQADFDKISAT